MRYDIRFQLICCFCCCVPGCMGWFEGTEAILQEPLSQGDSEHIAKWTLKQTNGWKINQGLSALYYRVVQAKDNRERAEYAIHWELLAVEQIEDWPMDRVLSEEAGRVVTTRNLIAGVFYKATEGAFHNYASAEELLRRLRPGDRHAQWLPLYEDALKRLEEDKDRGRKNVQTK